MTTLNGLPVYKMKPGMGIDFHSLVDSPAIEVNYKTFGKSERYKFNQEKQIITGPFMIPDLPIYRNDASHGEYYVYFDKPTILQLNEQFMKEQKTLSFNYQHKDNSTVEGAVLVENWIVGEGDNKAKELGFDVPVGTWMGSVKINNKKFWDEEIKSGNAKGFSIEGYLDMEMKKIKPTNMSKEKFAEAKTTDGATIKTSAEAFAQGVDAVIVDAEGKETPAEGDYTLENGTVIKCVAGKVTEMVEAMAEELSPEEVAAMSKMFSAILKPLNDKIAALETKLANMPGAASKTDKIDEKKDEKKETPAQTTMKKINAIKEALKK